MNAKSQEMLEQIAALSHEFGGPEYVLGGGGNTSCKDAEFLWVKPSGTILSQLRPADFTALARAGIERLFTLAPPAEAAARESWVQEVMQAALAPGAAGRPSVEAPLHHALAARYVVHTHPAWINGLTCARDSATAAARLFPAALYVPYTDPGYTLSVAVRAALEAYRKRHGHEPRVVLLENHGVFIAADQPDDIRAAYAEIRAQLERAYTAAGVPPTLTVGPRPTPERLARLTDALQAELGPAAAVVLAEGPFQVAAGPLSPDHIVYQKSFPFVGEPTQQALRVFQAETGYAPRIVVLPDVVLALGPSEQSARLALALARDGARVLECTAAFGGVRYLSPAARRFIENWEVESYRRQVAGVA
ncbi:MAG: class II aldolase/adducin family protein [Candidatus Marinimicrobia bacterium]|nr:class II aldolase/adducin family protein [Candidatus Neomarinimicrobiota bacterium]